MELLLHNKGNFYNGYECLTSNYLQFPNVNHYNIYMINNKYNFCSGYFPTLISLDFDNFTKVYNLNSGNIPRYYPYIMNNGYQKQISNSFSRYNNEYISKLVKNCGSVAPSSGVGTNGDTWSYRYSGVGDLVTNTENSYDFKINKPNELNKSKNSSKNSKVEINNLNNNNNNKSTKNYKNTSNTYKNNSSKTINRNNNNNVINNMSRNKYDNSRKNINSSNNAYNNNNDNNIKEYDNSYQYLDYINTPSCGDTPGERYNRVSKCYNSTKIKPSKEKESSTQGCNHGEGEGGRMGDDSQYSPHAHIMKQKKKS